MKEHKQGFSGILVFGSSKRISSVSVSFADGRPFDRPFSAQCSIGLLNRTVA